VAAGPAYDPGMGVAGVEQIASGTTLPAMIQLHSGTALVRKAVRSDLPDLIELIKSAPLGLDRETPPSGDIHPVTRYTLAFDTITDNPKSLLAILEFNGQTAGTVQIEFITTLSRLGASRGQIEAMRIRPDLQGQGLGTALLSWCITYAQNYGCRLVQVSTDLQRTSAQNFYQRLGFTYTHAGLKLDLL
jgi:ribosomal protein S18 acetylase RimI-like enzyme